MSGKPSAADPSAFISPVFYDKCVITSIDATASRVMLGGAVGGFVTEQTTLPQLTATVYLKGVALSPQPSVLWEVSGNSCTIDQTGVISRKINNQVQGFDSNGASTTGHTGELVQVTITVLRQEGSKSGVLGTLNVCVQDHAPTQYVGKPGQTIGVANTPTGTPNYFSAVATSQPPADQSA
jgi:hypothetical protein